MTLAQLAVKIRGGAGGSRDGFSGDSPLFTEKGEIFQVDGFHDVEEGSGAR